MKKCAVGTIDTSEQIITILFIKCVQGLEFKFYMQIQ